MKYSTNMSSQEKMTWVPLKYMKPFATLPKLHRVENAMKLRTYHLILLPLSFCINTSFSMEIRVIADCVSIM